MRVERRPSSEYLTDEMEEQGMMTVNGEVYTSSPETKHTDSDGLTDGEEMDVHYGERLENYVRIKREYIGYGEVGYCFYFDAVSDPDNDDSDEDGINDRYDMRPLFNDIRSIGLKHGYINIVDYPGNSIETNTDETNYGESYGGNQNWFCDKECSFWDQIVNENCRIKKSGCGLIALTDTTLYLLLKNTKYMNQKYRKELINSGGMDLDNNIKYSAYSDIVHKNNSGVMVVPALGLNVYQWLHSSIGLRLEKSCISMRGGEVPLLKLKIYHI